MTETTDRQDRRTLSDGRRVTADADPASLSRLRAGRCPGWSYSWSFNDNDALGNYVAQSRFRECKSRATRGDLCGIHDNQRTKAIHDAESGIKRREMKQAKAEAVAKGREIAVRLTEATGVTWETIDSGNLAVSQESALELLRRWAP